MTKKQIMVNYLRFILENLDPHKEIVKSLRQGLHNSYSRFESNLIPASYEDWAWVVKYVIEIYDKAASNE